MFIILHNYLRWPDTCVNGLRNRPGRLGHSNDGVSPKQTPTTRVATKTFIEEKIKQSPLLEDQVEEDLEMELELLLQPCVERLSYEQLLLEAKEIYADLAVGERDCNDIDEKLILIAQDIGPSKKICVNSDRWHLIFANHKKVQTLSRVPIYITRAIIAYQAYKQLFHQYYDFLIASQHPSASPELRSWATSYYIPTRLWYYGVGQLIRFFNLTQPELREEMEAFIYFVYSMLALL